MKKFTSDVRGGRLRGRPQTRWMDCMNKSIASKCKRDAYRARKRMVHYRNKMRAVVSV